VSRDRASSTLSLLAAARAPALRLARLRACRLARLADPPFYDEDPLGIYQKILEGKIKFPWHFDRHSKDLIKKLLTADLTKRLGNLKVRAAAPAPAAATAADAAPSTLARRQHVVHTHGAHITPARSHTEPWAAARACAQQGAEDIKKHKWFASADTPSYWEDMLARKIAPPIRPDVSGDNDTNNFECARPPRGALSRTRAEMGWVPRGAAAAWSWTAAGAEAAGRGLREATPRRRLPDVSDTGTHCRLWFAQEVPRLGGGLADED
jgi:hypothetical protein